MTRNKLLAGFGIVAGCLLVIAACDALRNLTPPAGNTAAPNQTASTGISEGRKNAARVLAGVMAIHVDILQFTAGAGLDPADNATPALRDRCFPLGMVGVPPGTGFAPWDSTIGGPVLALDPDIGAADPAEYDFLTRSATGETDYILSIRSIKPDNLDKFTALEFSFRAVNPVKTGHPYCTVAPLNADYNNIGDADFPSNDDTNGSRSLVNMVGGDVAIIVYGIKFDVGGGAPNSSAGFMNFLGPNAWLLFMRDNALQSGRFYAIANALTGGPGAFGDFPGVPNPPGQGFFQSVQVTGTEFDKVTEPFANVSSPFGSSKPNNVAVGGLTPMPRPQVCIGGGPAALGGGTFAQYAFADLSHIGHLGGTGAGFNDLGGFVLVIRNDAFQDPIGVAENVVLDPSANPGILPANANQITAGNSGYNETAPTFTDQPACLGGGDPNLTNHAPGGVPDGIPGCHEIGVTVFFIHS